MIISIKCWNFHRNQPAPNDISLPSWITKIVSDHLDRYDKGQNNTVQTKDASVFCYLSFFVKDFSLPSFKVVKRISNDLKESAIYGKRTTSEFVCFNDALPDLSFIPSRSFSPVDHLVKKQWGHFCVIYGNSSSANAQSSFWCRVLYTFVNFLHATSRE